MNNFDWDDIDKFFNESVADTGKETIPDGAYLVNVEKAELLESKVKGTPYINLTCEIMEGPYASRWVYKKWWLSTGAIPYVKADLQLLGFKGLISDFQDRRNLEFLLDKKLRVSVKTKVNGEYKDTDVYINGTLNTEESAQFTKEVLPGQELEMDDEENPKDPIPF